MASESPTLAVPGVVHVDKSSGAVTVGPSAGWITPQGIREWSQELSLIARKDLTDALREDLGVTLPENRIAKSRHPHAHRAAEGLSLIGVISKLAPKLVEKGVRVHTVGYDRVTGGFIYFAEGGSGEPVRVHGDLLEMIAPALEGGSSNADIERYLNGFIDRVLQHFSKGALTEAAVELANALPRLATDARGLSGVDLDAFETEAAANANAAKKHEEGARKLADTLAKANGGGTVSVPLFGEAKAQTQPAMDIVLEGAPVSLPARNLWTVSGAPKEEAPAKPVEKAASPKPAPVQPTASKPIVQEKPAPAVAAASTSKPPSRRPRAPRPRPRSRRQSVCPRPHPERSPRCSARSPPRRRPSRCRAPSRRSLRRSRSPRARRRPRSRP
jgi:hypothetical protein